MSTTDGMKKLGLDQGVEGDLDKHLDGRRVGDVVEVTVRRDDDSVTLKVELQPLAE